MIIKIRATVTVLCLLLLFATCTLQQKFCKDLVNGEKYYSITNRPVSVIVDCHLTNFSVSLKELHANQGRPVLTVDYNCTDHIKSWSNYIIRHDITPGLVGLIPFVISKTNTSNCIISSCAGYYDENHMYIDISSCSGQKTQILSTSVVTIPAWSPSQVQSTFFLSTFNEDSTLQSLQVFSTMLGINSTKSIYTLDSTNVPTDVDSSTVSLVTSTATTTGNPDPNNTYVILFVSVCFSLILAIVVIGLIFLFLVHVLSKKKSSLSNNKNVKEVNIPHQCIKSNSTPSLITLYCDPVYEECEVISLTNTRL
jgi:hypothetical protein